MTTFLKIYLSVKVYHVFSTEENSKGLKVGHARKGEKGPQERSEVEFPGRSPFCECSCPKALWGVLPLPSWPPGLAIMTP